MNTPTAPAFDIEVRTPVAGAFVLDHSELNGPDLLATDPDAGFEWQSIKCDATRIETWRGAQADGIDIKVDVGTLTVDTVVDPEIVAAADLQTGAQIRLRTTGSAPATLGTFTINDAVVTEHKRKDLAGLQITATDAVATLANSIRYGAASPTAGGEPWPARVSRLMASANVPVEVPQPIPHRRTIFDSTPPDEVGKWAGGVWTLKPDRYELGGPDVWQIHAVRELHNLTPGNAYRITLGMTADDAVFYELWLGDGSDDFPDDTPEKGEGSTGGLTEDRSAVWFEFIARSATEKISLHVNGPAGITRLHLEEYPRVTWAANIVTETNIARHLDIVTNTAGIGWYVDALGTTRTTPTTPTAPLADFSDIHVADDPAHACYTAITPSWGTDDVINDIAIDNINRRRNDDDTAWEDARTFLGPYRDKVSAARWGRRADTVEASIYSPPIPPPPPKAPDDDVVDMGKWRAWWQIVQPRYNDAAERLARSALARFATPKPRFKQLTFNALDFPDLTAALDVYETVNVTRSDVTQLSTVVSIAHQITATRWLTTLGLIEQD